MSQGRNRKNVLFIVLNKSRFRGGLERDPVITKFIIMVFEIQWFGASIGLDSA